MKPEQEIWAFMVHLGCNCWADHKVDRWCNSAGIQAEAHSPDDHLRFDDDEWRFITSRVAAMNGNMILLDLAEGIKYESHPELSAKGAWSKERLAKEKARLKGFMLAPWTRTWNRFHDRNAYALEAFEMGKNVKFLNKKGKQK